MSEEGRKLMCLFGAGFSFCRKTASRKPLRSNADHLLRLIAVFPVDLSIRVEA